MLKELHEPEPLEPGGILSPPDGHDVFVMPCSTGQKRFWMLEQISPGNTALQIPIALQLSGPLQPALLERALDAIVARHEILRTRFALVDDEPRQVIVPEAKLELARLDTGPLAPGQVPDAIRREMLAEVRRPLDFSAAPLLRATLVRLAPEEHLLMLTAHHIVSDGWSNGILVREVGLFYDAFARGQDAPLPPLQIQYADYAVWQQGWLDTPAFQKQLGFWNDALAGGLPVLDFPTDFARRPGAAPPPEAVLESLLLPETLSAALRQFCRDEGVTLFMVFYSAYVLLLHRYTGQESFLVGTTVANRNKPELEALIGLFANILMLRSDVPEETSFRDFLGAQRELLLGSLANHEAPFEIVLEQCQKERKGGSAQAVLQTHFLFQKAFMQPAAAGDLTLRPLHSVSPGSTFELTFGIVERVEGIRLQMEYRTSLFHGATIRRLLRHFQALLESIVAGPETPLDRLPLFAPGERAGLEGRLPAAPADAEGRAFDPASLFADFDRLLERHFRDEAAPPFTPPVELPTGAVLVALDCQRRLLPIGIPGDLYLGHRGARLESSPACELVSGPSDSASPIPLLRTGFIGRNLEGGGVDLWGRPEDAVVHQGFRFNRHAHPTAPPAAPVRPSGSGDASMQSVLHRALLEIWHDILKVPGLTIDDNFFACGGTSFLALRMMVRAGKLAGRPLPLSLLLTGATVAHLTRFIIEEEQRNDDATPLIPLRTGGTRPPLFFLHGDWAGGGFYCRQLAAALDHDHPFYALPPYRRQHPELFTMREMAAHHVAAIRGRSPHGPYLLGGYCIGATVAMEIARQLLAAGETVGHLFLVDPPFWGDAGARRLWPWVDRLGAAAHWTLEERVNFLDRYVTSAGRWLRRSRRDKWAAFQRRLGLGGKDRPGVSGAAPEGAADFNELEMLEGLDYSLYFLAHRLHRFEPLSVPTTFYFPSATPEAYLATLARASRMDPAKYRVETVPGNHTTCVTQHLPELAEKVGLTLDSLDR